MVALRERIHVHSTSHESIEDQSSPEQSPVGVGKEHFLAAFQKVKPSVSKKVRSETLQDYCRKPSHLSCCSHGMTFILENDVLTLIVSSKSYWLVEMS